MASVEARDFDSPDETRTPDKTKVELVRMSGASVGRMRLEPGWRWSECIKPIVGGDPVTVKAGLRLDEPTRLPLRVGGAVRPLGSQGGEHVRPGEDSSTP